MVNQLIGAAVAEKRSALETERYLMERTARGQGSKLERVLAKVPAGRPGTGDELD